MAAIDSDIIENLDKAGELVKRFVDALLDWKTENDARRARLDAMGDELLKYMAEIKNAARKCLPMNKSLSKSVQSNEPSAKPQSATLLPIPVVQHSPTVQLEIMHPTTSTSNQQKDSEPLKPTSKRIPIKKEIGTTKPKPTKNVTPLPRLLLSPVTIKKEARDTSTSRVMGFTLDSRPKSNLKRKPETSVFDDTPKIPRTTRSQAKALLSNDILESIRSIQGLAGTSTPSTKVPDPVKKVSKVGAKRRQSHV